MNSRVVRSGRGCRVFVQERPGVAAATTVVSNSVYARDSGHASLFALHLGLRVVAAAGQSLATALFYRCLLDCYLQPRQLDDKRLARLNITAMGAEFPKAVFKRSARK
jgi:hypothetical protein